MREVFDVAVCAVIVGRKKADAMRHSFAHEAHEGSGVCLLEKTQLPGGPPSVIQLEKVVALADPVALHPNPVWQPPPCPLVLMVFVMFSGFSSSRLLAGTPTAMRWNTRRQSVLPSEPVRFCQDGAVPELLAGLAPVPEWQLVQPGLPPIVVKSDVIVLNVVPFVGFTLNVLVVALVLDAESVTCSCTW